MRKEVPFGLGTWEIGCEREEATIKLLVKVIIKSLEHSQGVPILQDYLLEYVCGYNPTWRISSDVHAQLVSELKKIIPKMIPIEGRYTENENRIHQPVSLEILNKNVDDSVRILTNHLTSMHSLDKLNNQVAANILLLILERDHTFFFSDNKKRDKKSNRKINPETSPIHNPHISYLCFYGLEGHTTGLQELDHLYFRVAELLLDVDSPFLDTLSELQLHMFHQVITQYYLHHPDIQMPYVVIRLLKNISNRTSSLGKLKNSFKHKFQYIFS